MKYGIFLGYSFAPRWLAMSRPERERFREEHVAPLLAKYEGRLALQHYDAEAFSTDPTDFAFISTGDLDTYYLFIEDLRDSPLISTRLAQVRAIHIGLADGYRTLPGTVRSSALSHIRW